MPFCHRIRRGARHRRSARPRKAVCGPAKRFRCTAPQLTAPPVASARLRRRSSHVGLLAKCFVRADLTVQRAQACAARPRRTDRRNTPRSRARRKVEKARQRLVVF